MKKVILSITLAYALLICFSGSAFGQNKNVLDPVKTDIMSSLKNMFEPGLQVSLEKLKGKQVPDDGSGTKMYNVKANKFKMHADTQFVYIPPGSISDLFYYAYYGSNPDMLKNSLQAFIEFGTDKLDGGESNEFTTKKNEEKSKDGLVIYNMFKWQIKVGFYVLNEKESKGEMFIGFFL